MAASRNTSLKLSCLAAALMLALAACGDGKEKASATQVAARVNGSEITVHQINALLAKASGIPMEAAGKVRQGVLDKLVDQQLAYDQAVEKKLDRTPEVMMAIEGAKREIIARAYFDQLVSGIAKPGDDEIRKYYADNPDLFARRRVYNLQEISIEKKPELLGELKQQVAAGKSFDDIAAWLRERGAQFRGNAGAKAAEQIPLDILPRLAELKDGQSAVLQGNQNYLLVRVLASQMQPVEESAAKPMIQQFLVNQQAQQAVEQELRRLKSAAKIEYLGEFTATAAAPAATTSEPQAKTVAGVEKGVAGLK
ncbi:EpsD family peptidyl-prolyl cis-trans isomerase [Azonexus sp.]|uniref:EpsD family peptidyl-prolyl cis-trans isomerase n=1 Tax=Azonexus sp. TaxID=1872668 RepID=UPI0035B3B524